jgi:hypothetical protein
MEGPVQATRRLRRGFVSEEVDDRDEERLGGVS